VVVLLWDWGSVTFRRRLQQRVESAALDESTRAHRRIIGYMCHELRNPLHVLKMALMDMKFNMAAETTTLSSSSVIDEVTTVSAMLTPTRQDGSSGRNRPVEPWRQMSSEFMRSGSLTAKDKFDKGFHPGELTRTRSLSHKTRSDKWSVNATSGATSIGSQTIAGGENGGAGGNAELVADMDGAVGRLQVCSYHTWRVRFVVVKAVVPPCAGDARHRAYYCLFVLLLLCICVHALNCYIMMSCICY
jgi:hypothetical protein